MSVGCAIINIFTKEKQMTKQIWLTTLEHFGSYELTVATETKEEGIVALQKEFNRANKERGAFASSYTFKELLEGGSVGQTQLKLGKVEWL